MNVRTLRYVSWVALGLVLLAAFLGYLPISHEHLGYLAIAGSTTAFPVNAELTAVAIGYRNRDVDLIADAVLPRIQTAKKFAYTKYTTADGYTVPPTRVGRKSEPNMVDFGGALTNDECVDWGLDDLVPNDEVAAFEAMPRPNNLPSPLAKSVSLLSGLIALDREIRVATLLTTLATYQSTLRATLSGTSQWSDFSNSNPLDALLTALDTPIIRPNCIFMGQAVWTKLRQHPRLIQAANASAQTGGAISRQDLADLLEIPAANILIGVGFYNSATRGQTPTYSRVWGKHCGLIFKSEDLANADQPTFGFTAQFGTRIAGDIPQPRAGLRGGTLVRVGESVKEVIASNDCGYFFQNAVA